jgi:glycosyltransferase involved in cell wall biosynthesis
MSKICHVGIMGNIRKEGMITQYIYDYCEGEHIYIQIKDEIPKADIYILHCMKNLLFLEDFIKFKADGKIISLLHSSEPCMPAKHSDVVVVLTDYWKNRMKELYNINSITISGGIDLNVYQPKKKEKINKIVFGKICRPEPGKFHLYWNSIVSNVLDQNMNAECRVICDGYKKLKYLEHERMNWIENIEIKDHNKKIEELSKLDLYVECHDDTKNAFVDTFNMSMLEAMALGIPVLMHTGLQKAMREVLSEYGIYTDDIYTFEKILKHLTKDEYHNKTRREMSRARAEQFSHLVMIEKWNEILI